MKKIFSLLFFVAFLLVLVSFFTQKSFALGSAESLCTVDNPCTVWHDPDPLGRWPAGYLVGGACNNSHTELWYCDFTTKPTYQQRYGSGTGNFKSYCNCISNTDYNNNKGEDYCSGGPTSPPTFTPQPVPVGECINTANACSTTGTQDIAYTCSNGVKGTAKNESCSRTPREPTYTTWGTCNNANQNSCSLTGEQTRTKTNCDSTTVIEKQGCTLTTRPTCQTPNTCDTTTGACNPPATPTPMPTCTPRPSPCVATQGTACPNYIDSNWCPITPTPTVVSPSPTPIPDKGLTLVVGLDGIGTTGDQVNADWTSKNNAAGSNQHPNTSVRPVTLTLVDSSNKSTTLTGTVAFAISGTNIGKYTGIIPYGANFKTGSYLIKVTVDGHETKTVPGFQNITSTSASVDVPSVNLIVGDINGDNALTAADYNILLSCISDTSYKDTDAHALCNQNANYKVRADMEDNGVIDKFDYNLFLREFSVQSGN